jgi:hypothetical protein
MSSASDPSSAAAPAAQPQRPRKAPKTTARPLREIADCGLSLFVGIATLGLLDKAGKSQWVGRARAVESRARPDVWASHEISARTHDPRLCAVGLSS